MEEERLDVFCSLAAGVAVTHMTYGHLAWQLGHLLLVEDFCDKSVAFDSMELAVFGVYGHNAATLLASVLKGVEAVICKACCVFNTIDAKDSTLVVELVVSVFTITHIFY